MLNVVCKSSVGAFTQLWYSSFSYTAVEYCTYRRGKYSGAFTWNPVWYFVRADSVVYFNPR